MCYHYTIHRNVQTYAAGFEPASLFLPEEKLSKNCCKFPYFSYVLFVTTPSLELGNLPSTYDGACLRFTPRLWWIEQLEACQWRLSLFSLLLIFFLVSRHLFPRWYSHRFIRILTVTLSVTHINVLTITTCLGVPTTLYPHYCRHASTQDCGSGELRYPDPRLNRPLLCLWATLPLFRTYRGIRTTQMTSAHKWFATNRLYFLAI